MTLVDILRDLKHSCQLMMRDTACSLSDKPACFTLHSNKHFKHVLRSVLGVSGVLASIYRLVNPRCNLFLTVER